MAAGDINQNGLREIIITNFGRFGDQFGVLSHKKGPLRNFWVFEWQTKELKLMFHKQWDLRGPRTDAERDKYFLAYEAKQLIAWPMSDRVIVETTPPYLGLEWTKEGYMLREQQGSAQEKLLVGSWIFPWLTASCYDFFSNLKTWYPRECIVGIRDFLGDKQLKIVTVFEEELIRDKQYKQTIRVRKYETGFPIEWEMISPKRLVWIEPRDRLNWRSRQGLLLREFKTTSNYIFEPEPGKAGYHLIPIEVKEPIGIEPRDLPDVYLRQTQKKGVEEYWGYRQDKEPTGEGFPLLRKVTFNADRS